MEHFIDINFSARYFTHGKPSAKNLLVVLHGYGQLASYFIKKFEFLDPENYFVVAPEGLHRFYTQGTSGRVGASWMTKECREKDIANYLNYLNTLLSELKKVNPNFKPTLLGFSQGGATASRWMAHTNSYFKKFILWAAVFPPDMEKNFTLTFSLSKNYFVVGNKDQYFTEEDKINQQHLLNQSGIKFDYLSFDGDHQIHSQTLEKILNEN